jgi:hypothetical protein
MVIPKKPTTTSRTSTTRNIAGRNDVISKANLKKAISQKINYEKPVIKKAVIHNGLLEKPVIKKVKTEAPTIKKEPAKVTSSTSNNGENELYSASFISKILMIITAIIYAVFYFTKE